MVTSELFSTLSLHKASTYALPAVRRACFHHGVTDWVS